MKRGTIQQREQVIGVLRGINAGGLNSGSAGNASLRVDGGMLVSPSGVGYDAMTPEQVVFMDPDNRYYGACAPSSEWHFHSAILKTRPDIDTVLHAHSPWCMVVACCGLDLPAIHYMIGITGGTVVRCAPYRPFGTPALSEAAVAALGKRKACLLGNHGVITVGTCFKEAVDILREVEQLARLYVLCRGLGGARILDETEMADVISRFKSYGKQPGEWVEGQAPSVLLPERGGA